MINKILNKAEAGEALTRDDALELLAIENGSAEYNRLIEIANNDAHKRYSDRGEVLAQIGIEAAPCPGNCAFCSLAEDVFAPENCFEMPIEKIEELAEKLVEDGADELFLLTTASYDKEKFLNCGRAVKKVLPEGMRFIANVGDFDIDYAKRIKEAGFTGVYHVCRLGEGKDTSLDIKDRIKTLDAVKEAGLELYYCVEPIGPEHTPEEIVEEIFRAKDYPVVVMAVMKRICVPGTKLYPRGEISAEELAKLCAVTELCVRPVRAMGVHEPDIKSLMSGANQIYAEVSVNPRDCSLITEEGRGTSVEKGRMILESAGWKR